MAIIQVTDVELPPELEQIIEEGRREYEAGQVITCTTKEELNDFLNSL